MKVRYSLNLVKFWDLRVLCSFPKASKSTCVDKSSRKAPKYGEREQRSFRGSLCYYTYLMNIYKSIFDVEALRQKNEVIQTRNCIGSY